MFSLYKIVFVFAIIGCICFFPIGYQIQAQTIHNSSSQTVVKKPRIKPFNRELSFGVRLNTNGWSLFGEKGKYKPIESRNEDVYYHTNIYTVEFSEQKHPREIKRRSQLVGGQDGTGKKYIYAKSNYCYKLKLGYGHRRMIGGKFEPGTTAITYVYSGGLVLGMLMPYYVTAVTANGEMDIKLSEETRRYFMDDRYITGRAALTKGIGETQFLGGVHIRGGIHLDFARKNKNVFALETGITAEYYTQPLTIMESQKAYPYTAGIYISAQIGKRMRAKS